MVADIQNQQSGLILAPCKIRVLLHCYRINTYNTNGEIAFGWVRNSTTYFTYFTLSFTAVITRKVCLLMRCQLFPLTRSICYPLLIQPHFLQATIIVYQYSTVLDMR